MQPGQIGGVNDRRCGQQAHQQNTQRPDCGTQGLPHIFLHGVFLQGGMQAGA